MSHWTSGLPKLDIQPFDPTPLWDAAESTQAERRVVEERRRKVLPFALVGGLVVVAAAVAGIFAFIA